MKPEPLPLEGLPDDWIALVRVIIKRDGYALQAGADRSIDVKSLVTNQWLTLGLPDNARRFTTDEARDQALEQLVGKFAL